MYELIKTADGSSTLYVKELDETYHSRHGAEQESIHVFIINGLRYYLAQHLKNEISILEIGFGTGLNALLTLEEAKQNSRITFIYHTIEAFPIELEIAEKLNYRADNSDILKLHASLWDIEQIISENFIFCKHKLKLLEFNLNKKFDVIYYDAFGPRAQAEMWTKETLLHTSSFLKPNGVLVTYCAKGEVKRIFKKAGFVVQTLKGPPGKREMIRIVNKSC